MELSRSAGAYSHPPDRQAEALREIARQQATANTWNMIQTGVMAGQLAVQSAIHGQMEQVKRQTADTLAIQQELLNREQLQQNLEEFIFQTEKLVAEFSSKSDVPASTRYFLLQSVVVQVEEDGIDTAMIRGRDNKAAFERAMASVNRLVADLLKDPEVQQAIQWAEKEAAKQAEKRQKIETELSRLYEQRASIEAQLNPYTFGMAAKQWFAAQKEATPQSLRIPLLIFFAPLALFAVVTVIPALFFAAFSLCTSSITTRRSTMRRTSRSTISFPLSMSGLRLSNPNSPDRLPQHTTRRTNTWQRTGITQRAAKSTAQSRHLN